ncbi:glycosyltransferase [Kitasatospora sp. MAP5-34]|uniref:glycosyltransferase n=1 Tax=Kitasatospora sp. MAP5-34 TaxID=3035102 RepID=UPI0024741739|nr:glycosyltransferase [Kitasatospora sp. MAP5-34]MDH6575130.1 hypothetical protein [Kitasatospora sp. MAP5-34]
MSGQQTTNAPSPGTGGPAAGPAERRAGRTRGLTGRAPGADGWAGWVVRAALPVALALWLLSLQGVRLGGMGALGLLQVLPVLFFVALAVLTIGFAVALRDPRVPKRWPAAYTLGLIAVIHATPSLLYPSLRYAWAWKHIAVLDAMLRHNGSVPGAGNLDIYNQWPGFFQLNALLLRATGLHSALGYASWYPVLANVLLLGPLLMLYRSFTRDRRLVWGGVWIYYSASWVGQDYFSPQAFAFLLFVTLLALVMRRLSVDRAAEPAPGGAHASRALSWLTDVPAHGGWRLAPFLVVLVLTAAIVSSHPLTPLMLISVLVMLSLPRRNRRVVLPVLAGAVGLTLLWDSTIARPYISKNIGNLIAQLTAPDQNVRPGVSQLGTIAPSQVLVSWVAMGMSAAVILLALTAVVRHRWVRRTGLPLVLLAPLPLLLSNNYGGEMILRAYLFALPAAAFLAAVTLLQSRLRPRVQVMVSTAVMLALLTGLFSGYYSKESMNYFTPQEVAAVRYITQTAPAGSRIVSVTGDLPGGEMRYDNLERLVLAEDGTPAERSQLLSDPLAVLRATMDDPNVPGLSYVILTRAQIAECELTGSFPVDTVDRVRAVVAGAPDFRPVFSSRDAVVYRYLLPAVAQGTAGGSR